MGRVHTTRTRTTSVPSSDWAATGHRHRSRVAGTAGRCGTIEIAGAHGQLIADHVFNTAAFVRGTVATPLPVAARGADGARGLAPPSPRRCVPAGRCRSRSRTGCAPWPSPTPAIGPPARAAPSRSRHSSSQRSAPGVPIMPTDAVLLPADWAESDSPADRLATRLRRRRVRSVGPRRPRRTPAAVGGTCGRCAGHLSVGRAKRALVKPASSQTLLRGREWPQRRGRWRRRAAAREHSTRIAYDPLLREQVRERRRVSGPLKKGDSPFSPCGIAAEFSVQSGTVPLFQRTVGVEAG